MVQRGEAFGDVIRFVIGGGQRRHESKTFRDSGKRRCDRDRVDIVQPTFADHAAVPLACGQHVADEEQVEFATLGRLRCLPIVVDAGDTARINRGMPPSGDVMTRRIDEQAKMHMPCHDRRATACVAYWLRGRARPKCSRNVFPV